MKKLNITKEAFEKSQYFTKKYGRLEYVSESGNLFKTDKGKVLMFKESFYGIEGAKDVGWAIIYKNCHIEPSEFYGNLGEMYDREHPEDPNHEGFDDWCWENIDLIESELEHLASYDDNYEGDPYYKESTKKFGKESSTDDMEREFTYKGISITRYDYESLPSPMAATKCPDRMMKAIVKSIYYDLIDNCGWTPKDIEKYLAPGVDEYGFEGEEARKADKIKSDFWEYMEKAAVSYGMEYYEDLPEEEENYTESKKPRFGKKFKKMDESINWNGVVSKPVPGNPDRVVFRRNCPSCGKPHSIEVDTQDIEQGMFLYQRGARIQDAFPNLSPDEREFFMSGICPDCWENM